MPKAYVTINEFCETAHVGRAAVVNLIEKGLVPHLPLGGTKRVIPRVALDAFLRGEINSKS